MTVESLPRVTNAQLDFINTVRAHAARADEHATVLFWMREEHFDPNNTYHWDQLVGAAIAIAGALAAYRAESEK